MRQSLALAAVDQVDPHGGARRLGVVALDRAEDVLMLLMDLLQVLGALLDVQP